MLSHPRAQANRFSKWKMMRTQREDPRLSVDLGREKFKTINSAKIGSIVNSIPLGASESNLKIWGPLLMILHRSLAMDPNKLIIIITSQARMRNPFSIGWTSNRRRSPVCLMALTPDTKLIKTYSASTKILTQHQWRVTFLSPQDKINLLSIISNPNLTQGHKALFQRLWGKS